MRRLIVLLLALATASCARNTVLEPRITVALDSSFILGAGQEAVVEGTALRVRFVGVVEDSRCPMDAVCVGAGDARARLILSYDQAGGEALDLHTALEPRSAVARGYRVSLERLEPARRSDAGIQPEEYAAVLRVTRSP